MENTRDADADVPLVDRGVRFAEAGNDTDTSDTFGTLDSLDTKGGVSTLIGTWKGELLFYDPNGTLNSVTPTTIKFTETGMDISVVGALISFRYSIDSDQMPHQLDLELFDPENALTSSYVIPAFYKIEDDSLTLGVSFFSSQLNKFDVEKRHFPMVFELFRAPQAEP